MAISVPVAPRETAAGCTRIASVQPESRFGPVRSTGSRLKTTPWSPNWSPLPARSQDTCFLGNGLKDHKQAVNNVLTTSMHANGSARSRAVKLFALLIKGLQEFY